MPKHIEVHYIRHEGACRIIEQIGAFAAFGRLVTSLRNASRSRSRVRAQFECQEPHNAPNEGRKGEGGEGDKAQQHYYCQVRKYQCPT